MYNYYVKHPFLDHKKRYNLYRNKLHKLLRTAARNHYQDLIDKYKHNLKKSWNVIKDVIGKKKCNNVVSSKFKINNKIIDDPAVITEKFNEFYINIGPNLAHKITMSDDKVEPISFIRNNYPNTTCIYVLLMILKY